jgi:hypothetical protein
MPLLLQVAVGTLLCCVLSFFGGFHVAEKRADNARTKLLAQHQAEQLQLQARYEQAATSLEALRDEHTKLELENAKTVEQLVRRPAYSAVCLDADGVRVVNSAVAGRSNPNGAAVGVPTAATAPGR